MISMLTTVDNPFDPFTQFDEWYAWDESAGYHSCSLLARFLHSSQDLSEPDQSADIERAIDAVVELNPDGVHKKVQKESFDS